MNRQKKDIFKFLKAGVVCLFLGLLFSIFLTERANAAETENIPAVKISEVIQIDGKLSEPAWQKAKPITNFTVLNTKNSAEFQTIGYVLYDEANLYIGLKCLEPNVKDIKSTGKTGKHDNAIFGDDHVEIMIDPASSKTDYLQFAVNAGGAMFDCARSQNGSYEYAAWDGKWEARSYIGENFWSVEVLIPYYTLGITPGVGSVWGINLCRHKIRPKEELSSVSEDGAFNNPGKFALLKGMAANFKKYCYQIIDPNISVTKNKEGQFSAQLQFSLKNETETEKEIKLEWLLRDENGAVSMKSKTVIPKPGEISEYVLGPLILTQISEHNAGIDIIVSDNLTKEILKFQPVRIPLKYRPIEVRLISPGYRDAIFATQNLKDIVLKVKIDENSAPVKDCRLKASLLDKDKKELQVMEISPAGKGETEIKFSAADLEFGAYTIWISLLDKGNKEIAEISQPLIKLSPSENEIRIDHNLNLIVNGKPCFAYGYFNVPPEQVEIISKEGCNILHSYDPQKEVLDAAQLNNLKIMVYPWGSVEDMLSQNLRLSEKQKEGITQRVNSLKSHPGLLGWYLYDEPEILVQGQRQSAEKLKDAYELIKKLDPYHPCMILNNSLEYIPLYESCADIIMPDPYPEFNRGGFIGPLTKISAVIDKAYESTRREKPVWIVPQAFSPGDESDDPSSDHREPTFKEARAMNYLAIVHEIKGIVYFARCYAIRYPNLKIGLPFLTKEINFLAPAILSEIKRKIEIAPEKSGVEALVKETDGQIYVFAVNTTSENKEVKFSIAGNLNASKLNVLSESRTLDVVKGIFTDSFTGYEVHVYTTANIPVGKTVKQVQAEIDSAETLRRKNGNLAFGMDGDVTATASSWTHSGITDSPRMAINGMINENGQEGWWAKSAEPFPDWIQLNWPKNRVTIGKVIIYGTNITDYKIQYWDGKDWLVAQTITGNNKKMVENKFTPVTTDKLRIWIKSAQGAKSRISEIECYAE